jgi:hypothetical protein
MKFSIKFPDILIIIFATGVTLFSAYVSYVKPQGASKVLIRAGGEEWTFQADADETVRVKGPLGDTVVRIHEKCAWVESSPCENQTCVAAGSIFKHGQWAACLPNNVLVMILGNGDDDVDAVVW